MIKQSNIMIVGSGGREDALAWKLRQSPQVDQLFIAPGNGGSGRFDKTSRLNINANISQQIIQAARDARVDLVIVGSEEPLVHGMVDDLREAGIAAYGPSKEAAQLEGSKAWAVRFMERHGIPHPQTAIFTDFDKAIRFLREKPSWLVDGIVVKASGLAAGKGVFVVDRQDEAEEALRQMMVEDMFGEAGKEVLIQQRLRGFEVSAMAIVAGGHYVMLPYSEDHKQLLDGNKGPNTGGMGVLAPHPLVVTNLAKLIEDKIIQPTILGMSEERIPFQGTLYPGLMVTKNGVMVLEYNVRFGDPETQAVLPLLNSDARKSGIDLAYILEAAAKGDLRQVSLQCNHRYPIKKGSSIAVTLASGGYPGVYDREKTIKGLDAAERKGVLVFHGGTEGGGSTLKTNGGRVLYVAGLGETIEKARETAYGAIGENGIHFDDMHYRHDIGARER